MEEAAATQQESRKARRQHKHRHLDPVPPRIVPKVTLPAPNFSGIAVVDNKFKEISLSDFQGKYLVLVFYPMNFTYVCPSELAVFSDRISEFRDLGVHVVACAPDSQFGHQAFINTPRESGGLGGLSFPLLSDFNRKICRDYNVLIEGQGIAIRAMFLIDGKSILRHMSANDLGVGRNVDEMLRLINAFQSYEKFGEVCPANWRPGENTIPPNREQAAEYFGRKYSK